jgi:class 3 adenylate cyclase
VKRFEVRTWMVGSALALFVALWSWFELPLGEPAAMDLMFLYGRGDPPLPSRDIVLALVDDQAIETVHSWPWPREVLAESLRVIDRFGARVIAIDILFFEPDPEADAALEEVFATSNAKIILAVDPTTSYKRLGPDWRGKQGLQQWEAVLAALGRNINADARAIADEIGLTVGRAARVREKLAAYKRIVVRRTALSLRSQGILSIENMRRELLPEELREIGEFPELHFIVDEVERAKSAEVLERDLPRAESGPGYAFADGLEPPLFRFARHVDGPGVVNAEPDDDGHMRRAALRWKVGRRIYPQMGATAAAFFSEEAKEEFGSTAGDWDQTMLLSWPAIDREKGAYLFETCSLGVVANFAARERTLKERKAEQTKRTRMLCREFLGLDPADFDQEHELEKEVRDEVEFQLQEVEGEEAEDEEARNKVREFRNWRRRDKELREAAKLLAADTARLGMIFRNQLVFVGWSATGNVGDFFPTPVHPRTPGVVTHAVIANSFLTPYIVRPAHHRLGAVLALLLGLLSTAVTRRAGPRFAFLFATLLAVVYLAFNIIVVFNAWQISLSVVAPIVAVYVASAGTTTVRAIRERREKAQLQRQFGQRISPQLFDFLVNHPDLVHLEGEEREVTCFFSDLEGFTAISEQLDSQGTVRLLNQYMYEMNSELTRHEAYVNKFLGDGIMAIWGAFKLGTPHAERACRAALGCRAQLDYLNARPDLEGLPKLAMRIGIATGVVTLGDCGAPPDLRDYTVIGDSANLAARLESANKQFGTRILINGRTKQMLPDEILTRPLGVATVVGQKTPTEIHEVVALAGEASGEQRERIDLTARAVAAYRDAKFDEAVDLWRTLRRDPHSALLAELYLAQIALYHGGTDLDFDGVLHLTKK